MLKVRLFFVLCFVFISFKVNAQVAGYVEDFNDNNLDGWEVPSDAKRTFELNPVDSTLQIVYHRVSSSWEWDNFNFTPSQRIDATQTPYITVRVKSDVTTQLTLKPIYDNGANDWLQTMLPADNQWHTYSFELVAQSPRVMNRIYFYLDGGSTTPNSGTVYFDDLRIADSVRAADLLNISDLERAINAAHALYGHSVEGSEEGQFPSGSKQVLWNAILEAEAVFEKTDLTQQEIDEAAWNLYDACSVFESKVHAPEVPLVDERATIQTRYLYLNLDYLKDKALLFGMQDATGYGVGWTGDDDRSDIKDVCGDYPAFYSEEMYKVTRNIEPERVRYRITSAYERGGVISMSWHQYDPQGRGFYSWNVDYENIVQTILPGGQYHQDYKEKLKKVALFFKSLRGGKGESIPVIFRPYHEHNGDWFWWGKTRCTTQQYIDLWRFTVTYLRDSLNVHNLLYAISPSLNRSDWGKNYKEIFPGEDFIDIYGVDHYFGDVIYSVDKENFKTGLRRVGEQALNDLKLVALTEVGQEGLDTPDFFTNVLLNAIKGDSINNFYSYAAVWRNQDTNHHFAPYPGHPSVPDFLKFYDDPYTFFESDLPDMYAPVEADTLPPNFVKFPQSPFLATDTLVELTVTTNEKAILKYDFEDLSFDSMKFEFEKGQARFEHTTTLLAEQNADFNIFIRAQDLFGNTTDASLIINVKVDTLQRPVYWFDPKYDLSQWKTGKAPFVFSGQTDGNTELSYSRTVYFRKDFTIENKEEISLLAAIISYDNGAVLYLNGHEAGRINLPENASGYDAWAVQNESSTKQILLDEQDLQYLKTGKNVLSVEVHQAPDDSADLKFDLKLITSSYQVIIDYQEEWAYFSEKRAPEVQILGALSVENAPRPITSYRLMQNYPNPFNGETRISYQIPEAGKIDLTVFNILGERIFTLVNRFQSAGKYTVRFNAGTLPSGVYFYRLKSGSFIRIKKMILIK
ncbi:MAG: T9SS type A sorting domain-containing protein [Calditrichaeota bacterium]|nr:T9SS type A sorting domain-containing protein [Calditrichota bacterium]